MTNQKRVISLCAGALIALYGTALAVDGPVGNVQLDGTALSVTPAVSYEELQVTVSGEGVYWQKSYGLGEAVSVSTAEMGALLDGSYSYQVIAAPGVSEAVEEDESMESELEIEENIYIQFGSFDISDGNFSVQEQVSEALPDVSELDAD